MTHLRLVPPSREPERAPVTPPAEQAPYDDRTVVAVSFGGSASGLCVCRACSKSRHPAFGQ